MRGKGIPSRVAERSGSWDSHILFVVENWYQLSEGHLAKYVLKAVEILRTILGISLYTSRNLSGTCAKIQVYSSHFFYNRENWGENLKQCNIGKYIMNYAFNGILWSHRKTHGKR